MVVQCPQCGAGRFLGEQEVSDLTQLVVQCSKCHASFVVKATDFVSQETSTRVGVQPNLPTDKRVSLVVTDGVLKGKIFRLTKAEVCIGRVGTDIEINDPEISGRHCVVEVLGSSGVVTDLGSSNGTFVGEVRVNRSQLEHLGEFRIGRTTIMFTVTQGQ